LAIGDIHFQTSLGLSDDGFGSGLISA